MQKIHKQRNRTKRCGYFSLAIIMMATLVAEGFLQGAQNVVAKTCNDVQFIFARGSGESLAGESAIAWEQSIRAALNERTALRYDFYELGSTKQNGFQYPAVAVSGSGEGVINLLQAAVSGGEAYDFGNSVVEGAAELRSYIQQTSRTCPNTKFVLGGYSQGAMVISRTLSEIAAEKVIYVATFGDPKLYLPEGKGAFPPACRGKDYSEYRVDVEDCYAYEGVLGSYRPYQPAGYAGKVGAWCNKHDIMCSSYWNLGDHTAYVAENKYRDAAQIIANRIQLEYPKLDIKQLNQSASTVHNVAFLIDSTESMRNMIDKYKDEAKKLARQVLREGGKIALFEYRDLNDPFETKIHCDFSCDLEVFEYKINNITTGGGGDILESGLSAIMYAMNNLEWQTGANKSIVLLTDAGYHSPDRDGTTLSAVVQRSLEIDPVNVYTVTTDSDLRSYAQLVGQTDGVAFDINTELELSTETILKRPSAKLAKEEYYGRSSDEFYFDASASYTTYGEDDRESKLIFDWDLDGDGLYEIKNGNATISHIFNSNEERFIRVRVTDKWGRFSTMSAKVIFAEDTENSSVIKNLQAVPEGSDFEINFSTDATRALVMLDDAILGYVNKTGDIEKLKLTDVKNGSILSLLPFDKDGRRGTEAQIILGDITTSSEPELSGYESAVTDKGIKLDTQYTNLSDEKRSMKMPLVPDAGVVSILS